MKLSQPQSLRTRLTLLTLLIFLGSLWSLTYVISHIVRQDMQHLASEQANSTVALMAGEINEQIEARFNALRIVATGTTPQLLANPAALQAQLEQRPLLMAFFNAGAMYVDIKGVAIASVPLSAVRTGVSYADRDFVRAALQDGKSTVGEPVLGRITHTPLLAMAIPLFDDKSRVMGALVGVTNLKLPGFLDKVAKNSYGQSGGYILVSKKSRLIVTATDPRRVMTEVSPAGSIDLIDRFIGGFEGSGVMTNNMGDQVLASAAGIPTANWYVAVNLPIQEAFAPIQDLQTRLIFASALLTLIAALLARWIVTIQLRPMLRAVRLLSEQSLLRLSPKPLPVERNDEVGNLISGFNNLLLNLADREVALTKSEEFSRMIANSIPGLLAYWTTDLRCFFANDNHLRWFGRSPKEIEGLLLSDLLGQELYEHRLPYLQGVLSGQEQSFEYPFKLADGQEIYVLNQYIPRTVGGLVKGFFVLTTDISKRHKAELDAQAASQLILAAIEAIDEAFVLYDTQDRLVFCNEKYRKIYTKSGDLMVPGILFEDLIRAGAERGEYTQAIGRVDEWVAERMAAHRDANTDLVQRLDNGRVIRIIERRMADGQTVGFRIDISDLVHATETALAASQSKSQFLANMSHEIRTPMNAILGMIKLLQNTELDSRQQDYVVKTEGAARSLLGLLNDILDFSKIDAGKMELDIQPFALDDLLRDIAVIATANLDAKPVEFLYDIDPSVPCALVGDALRLQQILINLSSNAIKFTATGQVVVQIRCLDRTGPLCRLYFSVRDSGIGIAPENQRRIFEGFTQAEASTTRRFGGTGLGLAISRQLVAMMGGELELESELGSGSDFHFSISLPATDNPASSNEEPLPSHLQSLTVLVADDNPVARDLLCDMVRAFGWQVQGTSSGQLALEAMQQRADTHGQSHAVVFVDWDMPGMDGWETVARMRELKLAGKPPVLIMLSSRSRDLLNTRSAKQLAMINGLLVKPLIASLVMDAVTQAMEGHSNLRTQRKTDKARIRHLEGLRVLLVEDNAINQQVALELLREEGASVEVANDGQVAVQAVAQAQPPFDAVLMDLQMPVMDGFEATQLIRTQLGRKDLPVIAMTANAMASDREACLAAGMNDHVGKPFDMPHLIEVLLTWTRRTSSQKPLALTASKKNTKLLERSTDSDDSRLDDIDSETALARMGGNADLYVRSLQAFLQELASTGQSLATAMQSGDLALAARLVHTLKGLSSTLGANGLARIARLTEAAIKSLDPQSAQARAADLVQAMQTTAGAITPLIEAHRAQVSAGLANLASWQNPDTTLDTQRLKQDLQALHTLLLETDLSALDLFADLRLNHPALGDAELAELETAMANLDFEAASLACSALQAGLPA